jgi:hypothetical protein
MMPLNDRRSVFRHLHQSDCFVIPNPWDIGSARLLASLGFRALATTSSGFAWSLGRRDNRATLEEALAHVRSIANAVEIPVNADFEGGFAIEPAGVAANVARAAVASSVRSSTSLTSCWIPPTWAPSSMRLAVPAKKFPSAALTSNNQLICSADIKIFPIPLLHAFSHAVHQSRAWFSFD